VDVTEIQVEICSESHPRVNSPHQAGLQHGADHRPEMRRQRSLQEDRAQEKENVPEKKTEEDNPVRTACLPLRKAQTGAGFKCARRPLLLQFSPHANAMFD
ncbi:hypothetical protein chiPu_0025117, partial [Chiloscyllium punctatum]|nr:hypothetical protein [Chiloscyllium punctatum]